MFKYLIVLFTGIVFSQEMTLKIVSTKDRSAIDKVLIFSDNGFIGETNLNGNLKINKEYKTLKFVKENFDDVEYSLEELKRLNWTVELMPIEQIEIETVLISNTKVDPISLLKKLKESRFKQNHKQNDYYQSKVQFNCSNSILFSFNNIIYLSDGLKVNDAHKIVYLGNRGKNPKGEYLEVFNFSGKECQLPLQSSVYCSLGDYSINSIFDEKLYNYTLEESEDYFILKFLPKNKKATLLYEGYFIVDKFDFGILELNMNLFSSKNNIWKTNTTSKMVYSYFVKEDSFKFKFVKVNNKYFLENSSRKMICNQLSGNHKGQEFSFSYNNEQTLSHSGLNFKGFDFINYKFK